MGLIELTNDCNEHGRYLVVLYYQPTKARAAMDRNKKREEIEKMKAKYGVDGEVCSL